MKRVTCIVLALLLVVMLAGCGATGTTGSGGKKEKVWPTGTPTVTVGFGAGG